MRARLEAGYDEMVLLRKIPFQSHCEHHMAPITGLRTSVATKIRRKFALIPDRMERRSDDQLVSWFRRRDAHDRRVGLWGGRVGWDRRELARPSIQSLFLLNTV